MDICCEGIVYNGNSQFEREGTFVVSGWIDNLLLYCKSGKKGNCPKCHSDLVDVQEYSKGRHRSITFECRKCNSFEHFDGASENDQD